MRQRRGRKELIEEALAAHEAFRRLDVAPEHIFFGVGHEGTSMDPLALFITVKQPNGFGFVYTCGPVADEEEAQVLYEMWPIAAREWNTTELVGERERIWRESNVGNSVDELAKAWVVKKAKAGLL